MDDSINQHKPEILSSIESRAREINFSMASDRYVGALLRTLVSSKPRSRFLELGTGASLSLCWMVDGMDPHSRLITVDHNPKLSEMARAYFGQDKRVEIICTNGREWIESYSGEKFDLIFADTWPGKYSHIEEILKLVEQGGFYVVDDMTCQPDWPGGHQQKAEELIAYLENRDDFHMTKLDWSTGLILMTKKSIPIHKNRQ